MKINSTWDFCYNLKIIIKVKLKENHVSQQHITYVFRFGFCFCGKYHDQNHFEEDRLNFSLQLTVQHEVGQDLKQRQQKNAAHWLAPHALLSL